jgi:hypothetical protein
MTTTVDYCYSASIRRKHDDPAWYVDGDAHTWVATVYDGDRFVHVYADGEMRVHLWPTVAARESDSGDYAIIRYAGDLLENGIRTDAELRRADARMEWGNNAWFDLYDGETGEHLDDVQYSLVEAVRSAVGYLQEDRAVTA